MTGLLFQKLQSPACQQLRCLAQAANPDSAGGCQGVEGSGHAVNQLFCFCRCLGHVLLPFKLHQTYKARQSLRSRELRVYARPWIHARLQCIIMTGARGCRQAVVQQSWAATKQIQQQSRRTSGSFKRGLQVAMQSSSTRVDSQDSLRVMVAAWSARCSMTVSVPGNQACACRSSSLTDGV